MFRLLRLLKLLKLDQIIYPRWQFQPGRSQLGDGLSRNPPDRDKVRDATEARDAIPKTLGEAMAVVGSSQDRMVFSSLHLCVTFRC